jgi:hypothetical protein
MEVCNPQLIPAADYIPLDKQPIADFGCSLIDHGIMRPVYAVRDTTKNRFVVALYTPDPQKDAKNFKVGHTLHHQ